MTTTTHEIDTHDEPDTGKRRVIIAGGVVAVLAVGAAGYLLLGGGGSSSDESFVVPSSRSTATLAVKPAKKATTPAKKAAAPAAKAVLPAASSIKLGRDPFLALYVVPAVAPAATTPVTGAPTTPAAGSGTGTSDAATTPYTLTLARVTGSESKVYAFKVDGLAKSVLAGQRFGKYGELVVLTVAKSSKGAPVGALIQVGDDDPVTIRFGEKLTVL
jgi:hypothetical protein